MGNVMNVVFNSSGSSFYNIHELNSSFATGSIDIMYVGENRNGSDISKQSTINALPTLYNVPVVCNYDAESREIGGHDFEVVSDDDGNIRLRNLTMPCGVITDHTTFSFQIKEDENGEEHEYLVADGVVLWKRQDVYDYIVNDCGGKIAHSMEINVLDGCTNDETGYYDVKSFEFTALCLLGNATPCFEGSKLAVYSQVNIKKDVEQMMAELKQYYSTLADANADANQITEGGDKMPDEIAKIIQEFGYDPDNLDFSIEGMSVDEVRAKFEEMTAAKAEAGEAKSDANPATQDTFELNSNLYDHIYEAVRVPTISHGWGDVQRYWLRDFDSEKGEVYVEDGEDWNLYAFGYTLDGDDVIIDWESKTRKKYAIVDYIEGEAKSYPVAASMFAEKANESFNQKESAVAAMHDAEEKLAAAQTEIEELRQFKLNTETAARSAEIEAVFAQFADLNGNEMFEALCSSVKEDILNASPDSVEEKCYAIRGRMAAPSKFSLDGSAPKLQVEHVDDNDQNKEELPYGGIVEKYI